MAEPHPPGRDRRPDRDQATLFPDCLEDWIDENNPVRVIDVFIDGLDLGALGFSGSRD